MKKPKVDVNFSEQHAVDCDQKSDGCDGGWMNNAFDLFKRGFMKESNYKYTAIQGTCRAKSMKSFGKVKGRTSITKGDISGLVSAAQTGPVSVAVDASNWSGYKGGVITKCGTSLNHGVTLVGVDYSGVLKIRNSWGGNWGEKGHIRLAKGNTCGVANASSYPTF